VPSRRAAPRRSRSEATRDRLQQAALARFRDDGFTATSVAQIAADAGVTERTFFRYFASKEAVLFQDHASRLEWFRAALAVRPASEPLLDSVMVAVRSFPDDREVLHQVARLRDSVLTRETIELHMRLVLGAFARAIEETIRDRNPEPSGHGPEHDDLVAVVLGNAIAGALVGALDVWSRHGGTNPETMEPLTRDALDILRRFPVD
jgi:AcrR family transcriptional regulator